MSDGYLVYYYKTYHFMDETVNIRLKINMSTDDVYHMQNIESRASINKFKRGFEDAMSRYIWRYLK